MSIIPPPNADIRTPVPEAESDKGKILSGGPVDQSVKNKARHAAQEKIETGSTLSGQKLPPEYEKALSPGGDKQSPANETLIIAAVEKLKVYAENQKRDLNFSIDKSSGNTVIKVFNAANDELVRQMPSEEALKLAQLSEGKAIGGLLDSKV